MALFEDHTPKGPLAGTIVCLPGVNSGAYLMEGAITAMGDAWRVLRLNPPGAAGNALPIPFSAKAYARQALEVIQQQNVREPFVLMGHSLGGYAAQELVRMVPEKVARLILVSTSRGQPDTALDLTNMPRRIGMNFYELQRLVVNNDPKGHMPLFGPGFAAREPKIFEAFLELRVKYLPGQAVTLAHLSAGGVFSSVNWVRRIKIPTLVIHGSEDNLVSMQSGKKLAQALPEAQWLELYNVGHFPMLEYVSFWDKVRQFAENSPVGSVEQVPDNWFRKMMKGLWLRG